MIGKVNLTIRSNRVEIWWYGTFLIGGPIRIHMHRKRLDMKKGCLFGWKEKVAITHVQNYNIFPLGLFLPK